MYLKICISINGYHLKNGCSKALFYVEDPKLIIQICYIIVDINSQQLVFMSFSYLRQNNLSKFISNFFTYCHQCILTVNCLYVYLRFLINYSDQKTSFDKNRIKTCVLGYEKGLNISSWSDSIYEIIRKNFNNIR